jgi:hypothetical protein
VDPEIVDGGGPLSYGAIFSIIDGTNCSPKAVLACRSVNLVDKGQTMHWRNEKKTIICKTLSNSL